MFEDAEALELKAPETTTQLRDPLMLLCRISHQLDVVLVWLYVIFSEGKNLPKHHLTYTLLLFEIYIFYIPTLYNIWT
jgi:hypothetical protein